MKRLVASLALGSVLLGGGVAYGDTFSYATATTGPGTFADFVAVDGGVLGSWINPILSVQFSGTLLDGGSDGATFGNGVNPIQTVQFSSDGGATWMDALSGALGSTQTVAPGGPPTVFADVAGPVASGLVGSFNRVRLLLNGDLTAGDQLGLVGRIDVQSVPEPSTWAVLVAGLLFVAAGVVKRRIGY
jgi:hypothetical protein